MSEIRTHDEVTGIVRTLAMEAFNDAEHSREEYGTRTRGAMRWLEETDAALRLALDTATREAAAHWRTVESLRERLDSCEAERDEWKAHYDALLSRPAPPADAATEDNGYPPTLADARMHVERLTRSLSQPHSADERFFAINEARTWLAKTAAAKADAATEAVRELAAIDALLDRRDAFDGLQSRYDKILLSLRVNERTDPKGEVAMRVRRVLLAALSTPAPAPSAKEGSE